MFTNATNHPKEVIDCLRSVVHGVVYRVEIAPRDAKSKKGRELSTSRKAIKAREKRRRAKEMKEREDHPERFSKSEDDQNSLSDEMTQEDLVKSEDPNIMSTTFAPLQGDMSQMLMQGLPTLSEPVAFENTQDMDFEENYQEIFQRLKDVTDNNSYVRSLDGTGPPIDEATRESPRIHVDPGVIQLNIADREAYFDRLLEGYHERYNRIKSAADDAAKLAQQESSAYLGAQEKILRMKKLLFDSENLKVLCKEKMKSFAPPPEPPDVDDIMEMLISPDYGSMQIVLPFKKNLPEVPPDPVIFEDPSQQPPPTLPSNLEAEGPDHLIASDIPHNFPKEHAFRALCCYGLIRTLSLRLHISPFTPCSFLRALALPFPTRLIGEIHVSILRYLFANIGLGKYYDRGNHGAVQLKARAGDNMKLDLMARGGDNLSYMDAHSWPLFFEDYAFITAERLMQTEDDEEENTGEEKPAPKKPRKPKHTHDSDFSGSEGDDSDRDEDYSKPKRRKLAKQASPPPMFDEEKAYNRQFDADTTKYKKFRGRPRKRVTLYKPQTKKVPIVTSAVGKRRGRPPKNQTTIIDPEQSPAMQVLSDSTKTPLTHVYLVEDILDNVALFERYPHLKMIKTLRQGNEYNKLHVQQKLDILEFLLDELIQMELFVSELNYRYNKTQKYPGIFGPLPSDDELANLSNVDQCVVCGLEGELVCCDGCTASYHRKCIGLPLEGDLPPGKWLCVECKICDPLKLGPLRGGSKALLEWHSKRDIENIYKTSNTFRSGNMDEQYLLFHGFVFSRLSSSQYTVTPPIPLTRHEVFDVIQKLGPEICLRWPWCQIPFHSNRVWRDGFNKFPLLNRNGLAGHDVKHDEYYYNYFITPVSHNPTLYFNLYRQAPLPGFISMQTAPGFSIPQEDLFNIYSAFKLSPDLASEDQAEESSYDSLYPFKDFLLRLEREMYRASLLHELWGINRKLITDPWSTKVYKCRSVKKLASYTVKLVDAIHNRAFCAEWNLPSNVKPSDHQIHRTYEDMAMDWTSEAEVRRRRWERTPIVKSIRLMIKEGFITTRRSRMVNSTGNKRKGVRTPVRLFEEEKTEDENADGTKKENSISFSSDVKAKKISSCKNPLQEKLKSISQDPLNNRRRSGRVQSRNAVHIGIETLVSDVMPHTLSSSETSHSHLDNYASKLQTRIELLEKVVSEPHEKESNWTFCGRKFFPPQGSLAPALIKYLGRNGGSVYAPHVVYSNRFEVGQPCISHTWRRDTLNSSTIEELSLQLHILNSYLSRSAINTCESFARRVSQNKDVVLKLVKCTHRDPATGLLEYYVVQRGKRRGCWFSEENVDLSALIMDRAIRIESQRTKFFNLIQERKISYEMHDKAAESAISAAQTMKEAEQTFVEKSTTAKQAVELSEAAAKDAEQAKILVDQAEEKAIEARMEADRERSEIDKQLRLEREAAAKEAEVRATTAAKARAEVESKLKIEEGVLAEAKAKTKSLNDNDGRQDRKDVFGRAYGDGLDQSSELHDGNPLSTYEEIVHSHSLKTKQLLHESSFLGQATVPSDKMQFARQKTMAELKEVNNMLKSHGAAAFDDSKLIADLASAEQVGMSLFVKEIGTDGQEEEEEEEEEDFENPGFKQDAKSKMKGKMKKKVGVETYEVSKNHDSDDEMEDDGFQSAQIEKEVADAQVRQAEDSSQVDADAVLKAVGQHAIQQHLRNNLNLRQDDPNLNVLNFPSAYTDSVNQRELQLQALQQNLLDQSADQGGANSQLYAGYNLANQAFQLPTDQFNELQAAQSLPGNFLSPAAYPYARSFGGDLQLAQAALDPASAQFVPAFQQLDVNQQQLYQGLSNQQNPQFLQVARQQQQQSGTGARQLKHSGFDFGQF